MNKADLEFVKRKHIVTVEGKEIPYHKLLNDINGNPRFVIHFLDLGVKKEDYGKIKGLTKYRGKWFAGGYVIDSYNLKYDLKFYLDIVKKYYEGGK